MLMNQEDCYYLDNEQEAERTFNGCCKNKLSEEWLQHMRNYVDYGIHVANERIKLGLTVSQMFRLKLVVQIEERATDKAIEEYVIWRKKENKLENKLDNDVFEQNMMESMYHNRIMQNDKFLTEEESTQYIINAMQTH